jgi:hypothetical protein
MLSPRTRRAKSDAPAAPPRTRLPSTSTWSSAVSKASIGTPAAIVPTTGTRHKPIAGSASAGSSSSISCGRPRGQRR